MPPEKRDHILKFGSPCPLGGLDVQILTDDLNIVDRSVFAEKFQLGRERKSFAFLVSG
ncbi:hypothetical protein PX554_06165 [Sphingomonas sp. H39-1-10]|nr:hypothetical protein [Sphingomonas pollutisoli]MDF0487707.1 hypothetical protein [Sphingomonas pollutisoli]